MFSRVCKTFDEISICKRAAANPPVTGIKAKVETQEQYKQYLDQLEGLRQELGVALREELYPQEE